MCIDLKRLQIVLSGGVDQLHWKLSVQMESDRLNQFSHGLVNLWKSISNSLLKELWKTECRWTHNHRNYEWTSHMIHMMINHWVRGCVHNMFGQHMTKPTCQLSFWHKNQQPNTTSCFRSQSLFQFLDSPALHVQMQSFSNVISLLQQPSSPRASQECRSAAWHPAGAPPWGINGNCGILK